MAWLRRLGPGMRAVYEAGPTGFGLARAARDVGIDLRTVTPGLIPEAPTDRVKTDPRDAMRLARLPAAGELSLARVPTEAEEAFRDVVRAREDVRGDLLRARRRLSKLLLRRKLVYPGPGRAWTQAHLAWLARLAFDDTASTLTMTDYLAAVHALVQRRATLDAAIAELVPTSPHAATVPLLRCFRGSTRCRRPGVCADIARLRPLHPPQTAGRVPRDHPVRAHQRRHTPAGRDHQGRPVARAAAAGRGRPPRPRRPHVSVTLQRRQAGADPRVCDVAWRAQQRLHRHWQRLRGQRREPSGVVAVACARELSAFLCEAATIA